MREILILMSGLLLAGCNNPVYLAMNRALETRADPMGMGGYVADTDLWVLPVRFPTMVEQQKLVDLQNQKMLPMPVPWISTDDFDIEINWSMKNLDAQPNMASFIALVGGNEFGDYDPTQYIDPTAPPEDQNPPPVLLGGSPIHLEANEVVTGVFREDQIAECSIDLEAITRYPSADGAMATPFEVIEHLSTTSGQGLDGVPLGDVTPLMVRFMMTLTSGGHVALDYSVRVRDHHDKILSPTSDPALLYVPTDAHLAPPAAPMGMP
jgi:hypothetical protein